MGTSTQQSTCLGPVSNNTKGECFKGNTRGVIPVDIHIPFSDQRSPGGNTSWTLNPNNIRMRLKSHKQGQVYPYVCRFWVLRHLIGEQASLRCLLPNESVPLTSLVSRGSLFFVGVLTTQFMALLLGWQVLWVREERSGMICMEFQLRKQRSGRTYPVIFCIKVAKILQGPLRRSLVSASSLDFWCIKARRDF